MLKLSVLVVLVASVGFAAAGHGERGGHGGGHHHGHHGPPGGRDPLFQKFMETTKKCVNDLMPKSGLADDQQKIVVEMIKPMHELQREHLQSRKDAAGGGQTTEGSGDNKSPRPGRPGRHGLLHHAPTPPFKCSPQGELIMISPAEVYVNGMVKHLEVTDKISDRANAQKLFKDALPCMEEVFKAEQKRREEAVAAGPAAIPA